MNHFAEELNVLIFLRRTLTLDFFPLAAQLFTTWATREAEVEDVHWEPD
jgi:hypothetical protein